MSFLKKLFGKKEEPIKTNEEFWVWFQQNADSFFRIVKNNGNIEHDFFNPLSQKLNQLRDGYFYVVGMAQPDTAELIITADGDIKNIAFVEDLVRDAPHIPGWMFTALKPALDIKNVAIQMGDHRFDGQSLNFYATEHTDAPDEIDITITYDGLNESNKSMVTNGAFIFLDNFLGELNLVTTVDNVTVIAKSNAEKELIPIEKLKDYLTWRQKEFIEKYEGTRRDTANDEYSILQAHLKNGLPLIAVVNRDLLNWDSKASHPWILKVELKYDGRNNNGMPDDNTSSLMIEIEEAIMAKLKDHDGYLNIGRETVDSTRELYFACKDFREASRVITDIKQPYEKQIRIDYNIYKDKYWRSFNRYVNNG